MSAEVKTSGHGTWVEVPNKHFSINKNGGQIKKKTENFQDVAHWVSSSLDQWSVGNEQGAQRRGRDGGELRFYQKGRRRADAARGGDGDVREVGGGRPRGGRVSGDEVLMASPRARWKQRTTPRDL